MILLEEAINAYYIYAKHAIGLRSKNSTVQGLSLFQSAFISIRFRSLANLIIRGKSIVTKDMSVKQIACENSRLSYPPMWGGCFRRLWNKQRLWGMTSVWRHRASSRQMKRKTKLTTKALIRDILIVCNGKKLEKFVAHSLQPFKCSLAKNKGLPYLKGCKVMCILCSVTSWWNVRRICVSNLENVKHLSYHDACWVFCQVLEATWQLWRTSGWVEVLTIGKNATRGNTCM